jgi:hypothetical protein
MPQNMVMATAMDIRLQTLVFMAISRMGNILRP